MSTFSKTIIVGNLGNDPVIRRFEGGGIIAQFSVATTEHWIDKVTNEKKSLTEWHSIVVRGKQAENCEKYLKKGDKVCVEGKNRTRNYIDQQSIERRITEIYADSVVFMTPKATSSPTPSGSAVDEYEAKNKANSNTNDDDPDDLPF